MDIVAVLAVRWWAILIGIVIYFVVGMVWYGPIFGKTWMKLVGLTPEKIQQDQSKAPYTIAVITSAVNVYALAILLNLINTQTVLAALGVAILVWLGLFLCPTMNNYAFESRSMKLMWINSCEILIGMAIVSIVLQLAR